MSGLQLVKPVSSMCRLQVVGVSIREWQDKLIDTMGFMNGGMTLPGRSFTIERGNWGDGYDKEYTYIRRKRIGRIWNLTFWDDTEMGLDLVRNKPEVLINVTVSSASPLSITEYHSIGVNIMAVALRNAGFRHNPLFRDVPRGILPPSSPLVSA